MEYETRISNISVIQGGIVKVRMKEGIVLDPADLDENKVIYEKILGKGGKGLFLLVFAKDGESNRESREKFGDAERSSFKKAEALVVKTVSQRMESHFYKKFFNPAHPVRVFDDEDQAIEWLLSYEEESAEGRYETSIANIELVEEEIVLIRVKKNLPLITEDGLKENLAVFNRIIPNGGYFLSVFSVEHSADKGIRTVFESPNRTRLKKAEAFVINGLSNRIQLEYFTQKTRQLYPTKVFDDETSALKWLKELKQAH